MYLFMYIYIYICTHICICIESLSLALSLSLYIYIYIYVCVCIIYIYNTYHSTIGRLRRKPFGSRAMCPAVGAAAKLAGRIWSSSKNSVPTDLLT